jgi:TFIIF-interacting CTD phosphatase-like protein
MSDHLILLDLNGVLCRKIASGPVPENALQLQSYAVEPRPGVKEFLEFCYSHYTVGFFSSTTFRNADPILKKILTPEQYQLSKIKWFRDRTRFDPDTKDHTTIKVLKDLFDNPIANSERIWSESNTLLIDDSIEKTRFNSPKNVLLVKTYSGDLKDRELLNLIEEIPRKLHSTSEKSNVDTDKISV